MDVRIRPAGYFLFAAAVVFLIYRLVYTLLWEKSSAPPSVAARRAALAAQKPLPLPVETPITDWLVLAPIPTGVTNDPKSPPEERMAKRLDTVYIPDEAHLAPHVGDTVQIQGKKFTWVAVSKQVLLDLVETVKSSTPPGAIPPKTDNVVAYVVAMVDMPKAVSNATLLVGSDDGVKVWLNGNQILEKAVERQMKVGDDQVQPLALVAGRNTLVFKVGQGTVDWKLGASLKTQ